MAALRRAIEDCHEAEDSVPARGAINVLEGALRLYKPEEIAMSFNGGKDATVLLHLLRAAAAGARVVSFLLFCFFCFFTAVEDNILLATRALLPCADP